MRYERFEIHTATSRLSLALHPRLTVLAGVGAVERQELIDGFIGALGTNLTGVCAEIMQDNGRRLAVSEPEPGHKRVVDLERATEVTHEFSCGRHGIDLVGDGEIGLHRARRVMRLNAGDLATGTQDATESERIRRLADVESAELWAAADQVRPTGDDLGEDVEGVQSVPDDAAPRGPRRLVRFRNRGQRAAEHAPPVPDWAAIAGDIDVDWAREHRDEIAAAARLRQDMSALGAVSSTAPDMDDDRTTDLARALVARLDELRSFGRDGESVPLILDDPFVDLDPGMQCAVLDLLQHLSASQQIIFLTDDEDVASWARLEALMGALSIIEPGNDDAAPLDSAGRDTITI